MLARTFTCTNHDCNAVNPVRKNVYQTVDCIVCGTRYAIVRGADQKVRFVPFYYQSRDQAQRERNTHES